MDIALVLKIDLFSMPRFHKHRENSSLGSKKMCLDAPEKEFIKAQKKMFLRDVKKNHVPSTSSGTHRQCFKNSFCCLTDK